MAIPGVYGITEGVPESLVLLRTLPVPKVEDPSIWPGSLGAELPR